MENLTNFCLEPLINYVSSSSVTADGYTPDNLVSTDPLMRSKGLRVEHFMRPPTAVELEFKVPVHVACILCQPDLEANSEAKFVFTGSCHATSQKPGCVEDGYEFTLHSGVSVKETSNVLICLKNRIFQRMWPAIDIPIEAVSMVTGSHITTELSRVQIMEQPLKYPNIVCRLRRLKVILTRLTGVKPFSLKYLEVWGTLPGPGTCGPVERNTFRLALQCIEALSAPQLPVAMFSDSYQLHKSTLDSAQQKQTDKIFACNDSQSHDNTVSVAAATSSFPLTPLTSGTPPGHRHQNNLCLHHDSKLPVPDTQSVPAVSPELSAAALEQSLTPGNKRSSAATSFQAGFKNSTTKKPRLAEASEPTGELPATDHSSNSSGGENSFKDGLKVACTPSKFLDSITYEIMLLPMILPSGHCVDKSTIHRLALNDNSYGRPPTDPFTGESYLIGCWFLIVWFCWVEERTVQCNSPTYDCQYRMCWCLLERC